MKVNVLLFAHIKELVGSKSVRLDLEEGAKGADVLNQLVQRYPEIEKHRRYLNLAMNGRYITADEQIDAEAEVAVFPPVSGG